MNRIFVTRRIPQDGLDILARAKVNVRIGQEDDERGLDRTTLITETRDCDVLLSLLTERIDEEVLTANPRLQGVANFAVGFDNIDVAAATRLGIPVSNTPGVLTDATADLTWALILAVARRIPAAHSYMVAGRYKIWGPRLLLGADVSPGASERRKTLGIIGFGRIGSAVARRAVGFDMEVLAYDPMARERIASDLIASWADLDDLIARSDFVTLHPTLTPDTHHLIGAAQLRRMRPTAFLINVARGPVVDEQALVQALKDGWIAGAALDVYEREPEMAPGLAECENAVLVPHVASATTDTRNRMASMAASNAVAHLRGERAPNPVNPQVYESVAFAERRARRPG